MENLPLFRLQTANAKLQSHEISKIGGESSKKKEMTVMQTSVKAPALMQEQQEHRDISTLHARLHQEADKIRRWKIQTELDLREKEKKLTEASLRMETMKKSLLELQLENEKVSSKLQEEVRNREEVLKRLHATREICNLLKNHASRTDDRLTKCETEKTELKYVCKENSQHYEELTDKFKNLQIHSIEREQKLIQSLDLERSNRLETEEVLKSKVNASNTQIEHLKCLLGEKNREIQTLKEQLIEKESKVESLEQSVGHFEVKVKTMADEIICKEDELKDSALKISSVQDARSLLEKKCRILESDFCNLQTSKDNLALDMQQKTSKLEQQLQETASDALFTQSRLDQELEKLRLCEEKIKESNELIENLKSSKDMLMVEKTDTEMQLDMQKFQMNNLVADKEENKEEIRQLTSEIASLTKRLEKEGSDRKEAQDEADQLSGKLSAMELERNHHIEKIDNVTEELAKHQEKVRLLENLLSEEENKTIFLQHRIEQTQNEQKEQREQFSELEKETDQVNTALEEKEATLASKLQEIENLQKSLEDLKNSKSQLEKDFSASTSEVESLQQKCKNLDEKVLDLSTELKDLSDQRKETGKSLTNQQKKAAVTAKHNKELEKEIKNLKARLDEEEKMKNDKQTELISINKELESVRSVMSQAKSSLQERENQIVKLREECESEQEAAKVALKKAEEMQAAAQKEKETAVAYTDCRLQEMMATLDTYKQNNEKMLMEKETQIQTLTTKLENLESVNTQYQKDKQECEEELNKIKEQLTSAHKEKDDTSLMLATRSAENEELKSKIQQLESVKPTMNMTHDKEDSNKPAAPDVIVSSVHMSSPSNARTSRSNQLSTPVVTVTPQQQCLSNPTPMTPKTPRLSTMAKTPTRSILRACDSVSKRRKVAFTSNKSPLSSSEESDLMELDTEQADLTKTLLLFKSPNVRMADKSPSYARSNTVTLNRTPRISPMKQSNATPANKTPNVRIRESPKTLSTQMTRKPLGPPATLSDQHLLKKEKASFESLYPDFEKEEKPVSKAAARTKTPNFRKTPNLNLSLEQASETSAMKETAKTPNVRKAPPKKPPKFFSTSPRNKQNAIRTKIKAKTVNSGKDKQEMAWFDLDSVYGFGPED